MFVSCFLVANILYMAVENQQTVYPMNTTVLMKTPERHQFTLLNGKHYTITGIPRSPENEIFVGMDARDLLQWCENDANQP